MDQNIKELILIYPKGITPSAKKEVLNLKEYKIELFQDIELIVNITKHKLVPKHTPLTSVEKKELLKK